MQRFPLYEPLGFRTDYNGQDYQEGAESKGQSGPPGLSTLESGEIQCSFFGS